MATILFTYELGSGLGHLNRLIAIAEQLVPDHRIVFAVPNPNREHAVVHRALSRNVEIKQGALWEAPTNPEVRQVPTRTFADVAVLFGFHLREKLSRAAHQASALLKEVRPQLIVADFALTMRIVSATKIPTLVAGNGYTVPPGQR